MNKKLLVVFLLVTLLIGCSNKHSENAMISIKQNSEYEKTFQDLGLGILYDFEFTLPNADQRWVTVWVERYVEGKRVDEPAVELKYGLSPNQLEKGSLGWGIINPNSNESMIFLYAPSVSQPPTKVDLRVNGIRLSTWNYAIGDEELELQLGETYVLGVYRVLPGSGLTAYNYQDEMSLQRMINADQMVMLLKIKVEENG